MAEGDQNGEALGPGPLLYQGQEVNVVTQLVEGLVNAFDGCRVVPQNYCDECHIPEERGYCIHC